MEKDYLEAVEQYYAVFVELAEKGSMITAKIMLGYDFKDYSEDIQEFEVLYNNLVRNFEKAKNKYDLLCISCQDTKQYKKVQDNVKESLANMEKYRINLLTLQKLTLSVYGCKY